MVWGNWDIAVGNWNNNLGQGKNYRTKTFIFATIIMFTCDWLTLLLELRPELLISLQAYPVTCPHPVVDVHYSLSALYSTVLYNNDEAKHYNPGLRPLHPPSTSMFLRNYLQVVCQYHVVTRNTWSYPFLSPAQMILFATIKLSGYKTIDIFPTINPVNLIFETQIIFEFYFDLKVKDLDCLLDIVS